MNRLNPRARWSPRCLSRPVGPQRHRAQLLEDAAVTIHQLMGLNLLIPLRLAAVHLAGMLHRQKQRCLGLI